VFVFVYIYTNMCNYVSVYVCVLYLISMYGRTYVCTSWFKYDGNWFVWKRSHNVLQLCDLERLNQQHPPSLLLVLELVHSCLGFATVMNSYDFKKNSRSHLNHLVLCMNKCLYYYILWVYVCMYVFVCAYVFGMYFIYIYIYMCMYIYAYISMYECKFIWIYVTCFYVFLQVCLYLCIFVCSYICIYVCLPLCIWAYRYIWVYIKM